jgi:protein-tyrosine phosphatase
MTVERHLDWDGCFNARDLGGLRTADGREIRRGAVVRSATVNHLTAAGWSALYDYGIRTIVDLRNDGELGTDTDPRPAGLTTVQLPLDGVEDTEFWDDWGRGRHGTPIYYGPFLDRFPRRTAGVLAAIAHAGPGGVLVHCGAGRDRTGIVSMLLLALAGVPGEDIAADHDLSTDRLPPLFALMGRADEGPRIAEILAEANTTAREVILETLAGMDVEAYLRAGGLDDRDLAALRERLVR